MKRKHDDGIDWDAITDPNRPADPADIDKAIAYADMIADRATDAVRLALTWNGKCNYTITTPRVSKKVETLLTKSRQPTLVALQQTIRRTSAEDDQRRILTPLFREWVGEKMPSPRGSLGSELRYEKSKTGNRITFELRFSIWAMWSVCRPKVTCHRIEYGGRSMAPPAEFIKWAKKEIRTEIFHWLENFEANEKDPLTSNNRFTPEIAGIVGSYLQFGE